MIDSKLIAGLSLPEESDRRNFAEEIGESGDPEAAAVLVARLKTEDSRAVKEAILRGLSRIWSVSPVRLMIELLKDDDPFVRAEAIVMLEHRAGDGIAELNDLMSGPDKDLRKFAVDILSQAAVCSPDALYFTALRDADLNVVISAVENIGSNRRIAFAGAVLGVALESSQPMLVSACLEALAIIGTRHTLDALRSKYASAEAVPGIYLHSFLKLLGGTAGAESIAEICRAIKNKGPSVQEVGLDALTKIVSRHHIAKWDLICEEEICGLLKPDLAFGVLFHLIRLLGHFTGTPRIALAVLPYIYDSDRLLGLATVAALANSSDPTVEKALRALLSAENDPGIKEELEELLLRRRPRWNSPPSSSPN